MQGLRIEDSYTVEGKYDFKVVNWMKEMRFVPDQGLGKQNQGIIEPLQIKANPWRQGLGYFPGQNKRNNHHWLKEEMQMGMIAFDWSKVANNNAWKKVE